MTDSKQTAPSRIIHQGSISVATPTVSGHPYIPQPYVAGRAKPNQGVVNATTATALPLKMNPSNAPIHVPLVSLGSKPPPIVVSCPTKPISIGPPVIRANQNFTSIDKLTVPVNSVTTEGGLKTTMKVGIQKVSCIKQQPSSATLVTTKIVTPSTDHPAVISGSIGNISVIPASSAGKPVLLGQGLRQPSFSHQVAPSSATNTHGTPLNTTTWVSVAASPASLQKSKPPVVVRSYQFENITAIPPPQSSVAQDLVKKHSNVLHQPKTTISISMPALSHIPQSEQALRNAQSSLTVGKPSVYQIMAPTYTAQLQGNPVKKLQTMIVTQVPNSSTVNTVFTPPNSVQTTGQQITVHTGSGSTSVPAPTPPSIPVAKVYPQQQSGPKIFVTTTSNRVTVPIASTAFPGGALGSKPPTNVLQVGTIKTNTTTTLTSAVPTVPVAVKPTTNQVQPSLVQWSNLISSSFRNVTHTNTITPPALPASGTIRVQQHSVVVVDNPRTTSHYGPTRTSPTVPILQVADMTRGNAVPNSGVPGAGGPTTPTMSPKPAILRRGRPDINPANKKLNFSSSPANQRREVLTPQSKPGDKRAAPYPSHGRPNKVPNTKPEMKSNEILMVKSPIGANDKNEIKPILPNQVFNKQLISSNGYAPLKLGNIKPNPNQSFSIHNIDVKVKLEPPGQYQSHNNSVKSESASSASQMLHQYPSQSLHSYAADPMHRIVTQPSQHIKTNTIFTGSGPFTQQRSNIQSNGRGKMTHIIKPSSSPIINSAGSPSLQHNTLLQRGGATPEQIKKDSQIHLKLHTGVPQVKPPLPGDSVDISHTNHLTHNQMPVNMTQTWLNVNSGDSVAGLSPRKRPRKQTHIVSDVPPEVEMMEDEESTDDADECEDEPMVDSVSRTREISATPASKLPGNKLVSNPRVVKSEPPLSNKTMKEENAARSSSLKYESNPHPCETKPITEYTDSEGVRYVITRKRPTISVLNKLKPNGRSVSNHFMSYSDIKVKDKKVTLSDMMNDKKRLTGFNIAKFALQLEDMAQLEDDILRRMKNVFEGLVDHKHTILGEVPVDDFLTSPSPGTPNSLSRSFNKGLSTPVSVRRGSLSGILENGPAQSPSTPLDRRASKVKDEITRIEELAQANLQRCTLVSEQMVDTKKILLKSLDHRPLARAIYKTSSSQQPKPGSSTSQSTKRVLKKKTNS